MTACPGTRYPARDRAALIGALVVLFPVALALVPFRGRLAETNEALVLVVAVVLVAALGTRLAQRAGSPEAVVDQVRGELTELLWLRTIGNGPSYGRFMITPTPG